MSPRELILLCSSSFYLSSVGNNSGDLRATASSVSLILANDAPDVNQSAICSAVMALSILEMHLGLAVAADD